MALLPDFGTYLLESQLDRPFRLQASSGLMLGEDRILGWMINGTTREFVISKVGDNPVPVVKQPYMFSIYLGRGSKTRAEKILLSLQTDGLVVVARGNKKYLVANGQEWVVPLQYLKNYTS